MRSWRRNSMGQRSVAGLTAVWLVAGVAVGVVAQQPPAAEKPAQKTTAKAASQPAAKPATKKPKAGPAAAAPTKSAQPSTQQKAKQPKKPQAKPSTPAAPPKPVGLAGIWPTEVPKGLTAEQFGRLGKSWAEWSREAAAEVARLYQDLPSDLAGQRELLDQLRYRLSVMEAALSDSRYAPIFDPLVALHGRLSRRVDVAQAVLDVLYQDPLAEKKKQVRAAAERLAEELENLRQKLAAYVGGDGWVAYVGVDKLLRVAEAADLSPETLAELKAADKRLKPDQPSLNEEQRQFLAGALFDGVRQAVSAYLKAAQLPVRRPTPKDEQQLRSRLRELVAALEDYEQNASSAAEKKVRQLYAALQGNKVYAVGPLVDAIRRHYLNYNLQVVASEQFLNRFVEQEREDSGPVDDWILGAKVYGQQWTRSRAALDLKPSDNEALFEITLQGVTESQTQGLTDQATIYTYGYHRFWANKTVHFDGLKFTTEEARIQVQPMNQTTGASTRYNGVPILGGVARNIAVREAERRRPLSEAEAAERVKRRVLPEFNAEVEKQFTKANEQLQKNLFPTLKELKLFPTAYQYRTTEDALFVRTQLAGPDELAGGLPNPTVTADGGAVVHIHESLVNNALRRLNLAGRTVTDRELVKEIEDALSKMLGRPFHFASVGEAKGPSQPEAPPTTFVFDKTDPIRVRFQDGQVLLTIRTGIKQEEGKEDIPTQIITVPIRFEIQGDQLVITRGGVKVAPVERPPNRFKQIARAGVVRKKVELAMPERTTDRFLHIRRSGQEEPVELAIRDIRAVDGWLSVAFE